MHHDYHFQTIWYINAPRQTVSDALFHEDDWTKWWQGLERAEILNHTMGEGSEVATTWRSKAGYRLRFTLHITTFRPGQYIAFTAKGDLVGSGDFILEPLANGQTRVTINWRVQTTRIWMKLLAPFLRPVFVNNHHMLMDAGEKGLNAYVAAQVNQLQ